MRFSLKRLDLDFRRARRRSPWAGWLLLAIAVAFIADIAHTYHSTRDALATTEARLARLARGGVTAPPAGKARAVNAEEIAAATETIDRLHLPWSRLFGALEAAARDGVVLAAIEPDAKSGTVTVSGEARDYGAALEYVARLREGGTLRGAHLVKHEVRQAGPQPSVAFSVSASWTEARR